MISIPTWYDWECKLCCFASSRTLFQFQHGTIERRTCAAVSRQVLLISIPTWYDWELVADCRPKQPYQFQFQHGTIERVIWLHSSETTSHISIPTWYDWERPQNGRFRTQFAWFQFQHGTIERKKVSIIDYLYSYFSSNMVRLRVIWLHSSETTSHISIPTWYDWENPRRARLAQYQRFQFQHGTIERFLEHQIGTRTSVFQFQHGTIESFGVRIAVSGLIYFNSNMVRLRERRNFFQRRVALHFNSNMVRLRACWCRG